MADRSNRDVDAEQLDRGNGQHQHEDKRRDVEQVALDLGYDGLDVHVAPTGNSPALFARAAFGRYSDVARNGCLQNAARSQGVAGRADELQLGSTGRHRPSLAKTDLRRKVNRIVADVAVNHQVELPTNYQPPETCNKHGIC